MGARTIVNGRKLRPQHRGHRWYQPDLNIERDRAYLIGRGSFAVIARGDRRVKVVSAHSTRALAESAAKAFGGKIPPKSSKSRPSLKLRTKAVAEHLAHSGLVVRKSATERRFRPQMAKLRREAVAEENFREAAVNDTHRLLKARTRRSHLIETYVETLTGSDPQTGRHRRPGQSAGP